METQRACKTRNNCDNWEAPVAEVAATDIVNTDMLPRNFHAQKIQLGGGVIAADDVPRPGSAHICLPCLVARLAVVAERWAFEQNAAAVSLGGRLCCGGAGR